MNTGWLVFAIVMQILSVLFAWLGGIQRGYRLGLHAPLTARQRALSADLRRQTNGQGVALVRRRSADYSRPERPATSRRKG